ncbi:MAG: MFS transporter [Actinobacteria bacterium]|nr:MFS transporter [Actinomycetota bacterium]
MRRAVDLLLPAGVDRRGIGVLATGHFGSDFFQGTVPALLPFLVAERGYSYGKVGALVLAASLGSAFLQPVLGAIADRIRGTAMMPAGLFLAAGGLGGVGLFDSFAATAVALMLGGFGVAAYHPEAIRFASRVSAGKQGAGMGFFAVGGSAGFMVGPALTSGAILAVGLHGLLIVAVVELAIATLVASQLGYLSRFRSAGGGERREDAGRSDWPRFGVIASTAVVRATVSIGAQTFVPLYLVAELGTGEGLSTLAISTYFGTTLVGSIIGGRLADRFGFVRVATISIVLGLPCLVPLPFVGVGGVFALVAVYGLFSGMNFYPLVVLAQRAVPRHLGLAAGVMLGMSIGLGSALVSLLGVLADHAGTGAVLWAVVGGAALAAALATYLAATARHAASVAA